jgi:hypothetical protein
MRWPAALFLVCFLLIVTVASATPAPAQRGEDCTWGASSVMAEVVDGEVVQSEPATTGCIPG